MSNMSIKEIIQASGLNLQAAVTDYALPDLIMITQKFRDQDAAASAGVVPQSTAAKELPGNSAAPLGEEMLKMRLGSYGAAELPNQLSRDTYPEKILLLAAWHEARGGGAPWKAPTWTPSSSRQKKRRRATSLATSRLQSNPGGYTPIPHALIR